MSWQYYKNGKLRAESNDIPDNLDDAVMELRANGHDVSDCILEPSKIDDCWSPDYPPEEEEYKDTMTFEPISDEDMKLYKECIAILKPTNMKVSNDFMVRLNKRIDAETRVSRYQRFINWCKKWTDEEVSYLIFWVITIYVMIGVVQYEPRMIEIILWPFI